MLNVVLVILCFVWCRACLYQAGLRPADARWVSTWITALQIGVGLLICFVLLTEVHHG